MVYKDDIGDWRIAAAATLAEDLPSAYPGGPSHKKGSGVYLTTVSEHPEYGKLSFISPHPSALAFSIAFDHSKEAKKLQSRLAKIAVVAPEGPMQTIPMTNVPFLYDYFELVMIVVTFSFHAIEAFLNSEIVQNAKGNIRVKRRKKWIICTPIEAERTLSTEEKAATVLPEILKIKTPKGKIPWEGFKKLKAARDSTIHIKNKDIHQMSESENLFFNLLVNDPELYPKYAYQLIKWFFKDKNQPRWVEHLAKRENIN